MPRSFIVLSGNQELELTASALYGKGTNPGDTALPTAAGYSVAGSGLAASIVDSLTTTEARAFLPADPTVMQAGLFVNSQSLAYVGSSNWAYQRTPNVFKTIQNVAVVAGAPVTIWTPAASKKFRLMGWVLSLSVAGRILLLDNAAGAELARTGGQAVGIAESSPPGMGNGLLSAAANNVLKADVSASGNLNGFVFGTEE